jgi:hypothetical protein
MERLSRLTLAFAVAYAVFIVGPAFLSAQFGPYPLIKVGDVFDLLTPLVILPLYWLLYQVRRDSAPGTGESVAFLIAAALWVAGQGLHLGANAIGHLLEGLHNTDAYEGTHFLDEVLSHYEWHLGAVGLSALLLVRQWRHPFTDQRAALLFEAAAGLIYGVTYFVSTIEAGTVPLGVPFAAVVAGFGLTRGRAQWRHQPILAFFTIAYSIALVLFIGWAVYWRGFPQFSEVGLLK